MFEALPAPKLDGIIGLMQAFAKDPRTDKIDLGVGVYANAQGAHAGDAGGQTGRGADFGRTGQQKLSVTGQAMQHFWTQWKHCCGVARCQNARVAGRWYAGRHPLPCARSAS